MQERLGEEWYSILKEEFEKEYWDNLRRFLLDKRYSGITIYPKKEDIFNAYKLTPYNKVKVCIVGQDPYIRKNEAHGLAFSTLGKSTPSLRKIAEVIGKEDWNNNLIRWAEQGVFLLNRTLTVDEGKSGSHIGKGWEEFTLRTIQELAKREEVIFLLWGSHAKFYQQYTANNIYCEHPAAAVYQGRLWNNNNCFSDVNHILRRNNQEEIEW